MRISFLWENGLIGKVPRNFDNMRTEFAWSVVLDAECYSFNSFFGSEQPTDIDILIVIVPKKLSGWLVENLTIENLRKSAKRIIIQQEGPSDYWQDYTIEEQMWYLDLLVHSDAIFCHSDCDKSYYSGLLNKSNVYVNHTLMLTDNLIVPEIKKNEVLLGGNFVRWYSGIDSYMIAQEFKMPIYSVSMGRKQADEDLIEDIIYLPYLNWIDFVRRAAEFYVGVHMMKTPGAGTFPMNLASAGIPCLGYNLINTQRNLHIHTTVEINDLVSARKIARQLRDDKDFYNECSVTSKQNFIIYYSEEIYKKNMIPILEKILKG